MTTYTLIVYVTLHTLAGPAGARLPVAEGLTWRQCAALAAAVRAEDGAILPSIRTAAGGAYMVTCEPETE